MKSIKVNLVRVFTNINGKFGNLVSIVLDEEGMLDSSARQTITKKFGHDETVFINDQVKGIVSIFSPQNEIKFAGHAMVGTAWFLSKLNGQTINTIHCLGGVLDVWQEGEIIWVRANLNMMPPWNHVQFGTVEAVENLLFSETEKMEHTMVWAWIDEKNGTIRARTFASDWGLPESEGNGSGSMMLAAILKRKLEITHGKGAIIFANAVGTNQADIGGRVVEERGYEI